MSKLVVYVPRVTGRERVEVNEEDSKEKGICFLGTLSSSP